MSENTNKTPSKGFLNIPWWVQSIVILAVTGTVCYKIVTTDFNMAFDFTSFLSLALALFSVLLAALFYFKATDTSNAFYDNTYKFTQDIAQLLVKIESGFGEKLTHLDDSYKGMRERFENFTPAHTEETQTKIKENKEAAERVSKDLNEMLKNVLDKADLKEAEQAIFLKELQAKEKELNRTQIKIEELTKRLESSHRIAHAHVPSRVTHYFLNIYHEHLQEFGKLSKEKLIKKMNALLPGMHEGFLEDLETFKLYKDARLTSSGEDFFWQKYVLKLDEI